ncbi:4-(cytidine 5'-diphospho)-2-C-methyl-D-erythritol kinase [Kineococcus rubinsiae]|uniref:4-(cytidine 5'-diphospho)-2-C-methyl-D-erythritol kinase n=1 Tax=Kineococcus rubinsiae TaxID=2609562 RepID=UPI00142FC55F|nr:4-(cytidine 5'-diphospho)-2-C-methyl-D-erythritol kinase [Kineococcus rubinsiae]NIZ92172.1 4-(cytidine 5'-diphospho)-2-C-methyl-D-erythritol kinase [Kineococcus rubinsiae]
MPSPAPGAAVTARAPAKVNLLLQVGPRRDDGYHDLLTVFQALSLHEDVRASLAEGPAGRVRVTGTDGTDVSRVPLDGSNLAVRAVRLLAERTGTGGALDLHLHKGVPVAGGMAGGSADAAAALVAADALWGTHLGLEQLGELAAELGSDVPFALHGRTAVGTGRGERLVPVMTTATFSWVLVTSPVGLSTPAVFREFDRLTGDGGSDLGDVRRLRAVETALRAGDPAQLGAALHNDLAEAALSLAPHLAGTMEAGRAAGAMAAVVSGSGPTVALLAESPAAAADLAAALTDRHGAQHVRTASGPVLGAHVLEAVRATAVTDQGARDAGPADVRTSPPAPERSEGDD